MSADSAIAYETHARQFLLDRDPSPTGAGVVAGWARSLPSPTDILELGCGGGLPVTQALADAGHRLWAVDSSATLLSEFQARFPGVPVDCARVQESACFGRMFGAVIAIGLVFLLNAEDQSALVHRVSGILDPGGRFLFTAPVETGTWADMTTGHECRSLGRERYEAIFAEAALRLVSTYVDEGHNHYYEVEATTAWSA